MRRMVVRLACVVGPLAFLFSPCGGPQAQMLQEQIGDERQQRMPMQPSPSPALKVIKPELFLELLVRLLAHSAGLDERCQLLQ